METRLKLFAGLLVIICIVQLVQMAPAEENKEESFIDKAQEELSKFLNNENTKKMIDGASSAFSEIAKNLETQFNQFREKLERDSAAKN